PTGIRPLGDPRQLTLIVLFERPAVFIGAIEVAFHLGIVDTGIEIAEVPLGQRAKHLRVRSHRRCGARLSGALRLGSRFGRWATVGGAFGDALGRCWHGDQRCWSRSQPYLMAAYGKDKAYNGPSTYCADRPFARHTLPHDATGMGGKPPVPPRCGNGADRRQAG